MKQMRGRMAWLWLAAVIGAGCGEQSTGGGSAPAGDPRVSIGGLSLMLPMLDVESPQDDIDALKPFMTADDVFAFPPNVYLLAQNLKSQVTGLELATGGTSISTLLPGIPSIPGDIECVTYDYEPGFTPEFSADQATTIGLFEQLLLACRASGKKLVAAPVYVYGRAWDWGEVARHMDVLVLQVQNFQTGAVVPDALKPAALGIDLVGAVREVVGEVRAKAPATRVYLQFDVLVTDQPANVLKDMEAVKGLGIDGYALWYNPGTSGGTSKLDLLVEVLDGLRRD